MGRWLPCGVERPLWPRSDLIAAAHHDLIQIYEAGTSVWRRIACFPLPLRSTLAGCLRSHTVTFSSSATSITPSQQRPIVTLSLEPLQTIRDHDRSRALNLANTNSTEPTVSHAPALRHAASEASPGGARAKDERCALRVLFTNKDVNAAYPYLPRA